MESKSVLEWGLCNGSFSDLIFNLSDNTFLLDCTEPDIEQSRNYMSGLLSRLGVAPEPLFASGLSFVIGMTVLNLKAAHGYKAPRILFKYSSAYDLPFVVIASIFFSITSFLEI